MKQDFIEQWSSPPAALRSRLFWAWNSRLEEQELRRQIGDMQAAGMGGFFMHSRIGLATPYLSEEWFRMVNICIDEAEKRGMYAELYDEDRWPSGGCGGQVAQDPDCRMRYLCAAFADANPRIDPERDKILARFAVRSDRTFRRLTRSGKAGGGEREMLFVRRIAEPISWFNDQSPADLLNRKTSRHFLALTHDAYFRRCGEAFGRNVTSIFTDEPNYMYVSGVMNSDEPGYAGQPLVWTESFPRHFRKRHHYDLLDHLPDLWFHTAGEKAGQVRRDFYDTAAHLMAENYFKPIGAWCKRHGIAFTGHCLGEDTLTGQTSRTGEVMRFYKYMQEPGIDVLTDHSMCYLTAKQCASAARQYGKKFRISETYGGAGWDLSLAGMKTIGDWQYALGINRRCLHLGWYSMKGERKRDFPLDFGSFSGNREALANLENYFARLGVALTQGKECAKLLVIHPIEDFWRDFCGEEIINYAGGDSDRDKPFTTLVHQLLAEHLDFDLGSEELLAGDGRVCGKAFFAGKAAYEAVLVPEMGHLRESTRSLLTEFVRAGGTVYTLSDVFPEGIKTSRETLARDLEDAVRTFSITDPAAKEIPNVLGALRIAGKSRIFFACNTGVDKITEPFYAPAAAVRDLVNPAATIRILSPQVRHVYHADPATGEFRKYPFRYDGRFVELDCAFPRQASSLFILTDSHLPTAPALREADGDAVLPRLVSARHDGENVLVLDHALLSAENFVPDKPQYILSLDSDFRKDCGLEAYNWRAVQPYLMPDPPRGKAFELVYPFDIAVLPEKAVTLAHEFPGDHALFCNGIKLDKGAAPPWAGKGLQYLSIPPELLREGPNSIAVRGVYDVAEGMFEAMYLSGDFGVDRSGHLCRMPEKGSLGDWREQGFPFCGGSMVYHFEFTSPQNASGIRVSLPDADAFAVSFQLNDGEETPPVWEPFAARLAGPVIAGKNRLTVRIHATLRNMMGPFYCRIPMVIAMPSHFRRYDAPDRQTVPYGLNQLPEIRLIP